MKASGILMAPVGAFQGSSVKQETTKKIKTMKFKKDANNIFPPSGIQKWKRLAVIMNSGEDCVCMPGMHIFTCIYLCVYVFLCMNMCVIVHVHPRNKTCRFLTMPLVWIWINLWRLEWFGFSTWCGVHFLPPSFDFTWFLFSHCLVWKIGTPHSVHHYVIVIWCTDACYLRHAFIKIVIQACLISVLQQEKMKRQFFNIYKQ